MGIGEGSFLMAKKLCLDQVMRHGRTVYGYERAISAIAIVVDGACDEFLAGACFATYEHGGIPTLAYLMDHFLHFSYGVTVPYNGVQGAGGLRILFYAV